FDEPKLWQEVSFTVAKRQGKMNAQQVTALPRGTLAKEDPSDEIYTGKITRLGTGNEDTGSSSCGVIAYSVGDEQCEATFSTTSLRGKRFRKNDTVNFRLAPNRVTGKPLAVQISKLKQLFRGRVENLCDNYGFLDHRTIFAVVQPSEDGGAAPDSAPSTPVRGATPVANSTAAAASPSESSSAAAGVTVFTEPLFFHATGVVGEQVRPGDLVEFAVDAQSRNKRTAVQVRKIESAEPARRPARLTTSTHLTSSPTSGSPQAGAFSNEKRMLPIRAPKGPDGTLGFAFSRTVAGELPETLPSGVTVTETQPSVALP
ncbi:hypothetical protein CAOG_08480, partial [Capsaspora owczarzaki ATCC 30864]